MQNKLDLRHDTDLTTPPLMQRQELTSLPGVAELEHSDARLKAAGGGDIGVLGAASVQVGVPGTATQTPVTVLATDAKLPAPALLGVDALKTLSVTIDAAADKATVLGHHVQLRTTRRAKVQAKAPDAQRRKVRKAARKPVLLHAPQEVEIPARSVLAVSVRVPGAAPGQTVVIEPVTDQVWVSRHPRRAISTAMALAVVDNGGRVTVAVGNERDRPYRISRR
jgi:hypothetical protein